MRAPITLVAMALALTGCGGDGSAKPPEAPKGLTVTSTAFGDQSPIPERYTCDGDDTPPPLAWALSELGDVTGWAIVVSDPDAPSGTFTHWVVTDVPADVTRLDGSLPAGAVEAENSGGGVGYTGPCPPSGKHHYHFIVYGLSAPTELAPGSSLKDALAAIEGKAIVSGQLVGTYARQ